jgi:transcriptional regulator with XRE-family HTH domain
LRGISGKEAQSLEKTVAMNLRAARKERKLTQEALAEKVGIHATYVGYMENGKHSPSIEMIERLCKALKIEPASLFRKP